MSSVALKLDSKSQLPVIRQHETAECGLACLAMIAHYHGLTIDLATLRRLLGSSLQGMTLKSLVNIATKMNFSPRPIHVPLDMTGYIRLPAIIHWNMNHFVVLKSVSRNKFVIHDPSFGKRTCTKDEFSRHFTGVVLELLPTGNFRKRKEKTVFKLSDLWERMYGFKRNLLQVIALSIILQLFVLVSPFYLQITVDEVLISHDHDLLIVLAAGFGGFTIIHFVTSALRAYVLLFFGSMLSYQMICNLFHHLLRLPVDFFEKRHVGDIVSRFGSMQPIRTMITEGIIAAIIDGFMAVTTFIMMYVYSPILAGTVFSFWLLYLALRLLFYKPYREAQARFIVSQARENTTFVETIRGIASIKLTACVNDWEHIWQNNFADVINNDARWKKLDIWFQNANQLIFGCEHIILVYLAVRMAMDANFTVGMIFAFMAYKQKFTGNATALVESLVDYRMLGLHLERIADIACAEKENSAYENSNSSDIAQSVGKLTLENVRYCYSKDEPEILKGITLEVDAGDSIAIVGSSGSGKTTLLKIMSSLFLPSEGRVLINGFPLSNYGVEEYRQQIGVLMQEDNLFSGSLAENIAFFDRDMNMKNVISAARIAMIHDDICRMPMKYESLAGDMGSALSGGQKQRLLLARALYRQPKILFMDEGTAHLDVKTERQINNSIAALGITRILIAHRPETIRHASRILMLGNGLLEDITINIKGQAKTHHD